MSNLKKRKNQQNFPASQEHAFAIEFVRERYELKVPAAMALIINFYIDNNPEVGEAVKLKFALLKKIKEAQERDKLMLENNKAESNV